VTGRLTPLGWALCIIGALLVALSLTICRLDSVNADRYHWRAVAAARDTLVQDAQGRAHRAAVDLASVREMYGVLEQANREQAETIRRLRARPATVTTVTVQAPAETLVVATSDTVWASLGIREYRFDFAGAGVQVRVDSVGTASASILYKPVRLTVTTSLLRDKSWRTDVAVDPQVWEIADIQSYVHQERPGAIARFIRRWHGPFLLAGAFCLGLQAAR